MRRLILVAIVTVFLAMPCVSAFAEESDAKKKAEDLPWDKASISLGSLVSSTNSNIRLSAEGLGIGIDVEEALGLDTTQTVFRAGGIWRFSDNRRHRADLSWFAIRRDGSTQLVQDITIDGVTYPTGTQANTSFDLDVYKATYSYSFLQDDRMDIGAGIGLYIMPLRFEFTASGVVNGQVSEAVTAPLPVFGLAVENFNLAVEAEGEDYPEINFKGKIEYRYFGAILYGRIYF